MSPSSLCRLITAGVLLLLLGVPASARLALQTFESLSSGQSPGGPWRAPGATLVVSDESAASGEHSLSLAAPVGSTATQAEISSILVGDNPGFVNLWLKPVARTVAEKSDGQPVESSGVLILDGAHFLFQRQANRYSVLALSGTAEAAPRWLRLGGFAGTPVDYELEDTGGRAKDWLQLTVRRDLAAGTYDVWVNQRLVGVDFTLHRTSGAPEFRWIHRPSTSTADGPLASMLLDDVQAGPLHPLYADTDRDAMPDVWEAAYEGHINPERSISLDITVPDRSADLDFDAVPKISEYLFGSRPTQLDSDADGIPDGVEIQHVLNPGSRLDAALDKDGDGFSNLAESRGQGNANISVPPAGALTNVVYVKADHVGEQNGNYASPYRTLGAALASPYLTAGGRIVVRGEGGPLYHLAADGVSSLGNASLSITRAVTLAGVNLAQIHLQESASFATVSITGASITPSFVCENIRFENCWGDDGGVFRVVGTPGEVVLRNCRFSGCYAADDGGAVYAHAARLTIEDCWFENCWTNGEGGALHLEGGSFAAIRRTQFQSTTSDTDGGAVSLRGATASPISFESCVFLGNAARRGGALAAVEGADATLVQCTATGNVASAAASGGALFGGSSATLFSARGCIFWNNSAGGTPHAHLAGGLVSATYSTLSGWTAASGPAGAGNNASDPLFRAGTVVPTSTSMVDSSDPAFNATADFLNNPRWDAPGGTAGTVADRGAFERQPDSDGDGLSDDWENRYSLNPGDPADAEADADQDGYSNHEEFGDKTDPRSPYSVRAPVVFVSATTGRDWHPGPNPPAGTASATLQGTRNYPFQSIRRAILACPTGRRIVLLDGTYTGPGNTNLKLSESWSWMPHLATTSLTSNLSLNGKTLRGLNGAGRATLDGGGTTRLLDLALSTSSMSNTVILQNLSLRRGVADLGGAIRAVGAPGVGYLTMQGCVLSANRATSAGGAVYVWGAGVSLDKCALYGNDAPRGGAVALVNLSPTVDSIVSTASFTHCRFAYNLAFAVGGTTLGQGGALSVQTSSLTTFQTRFDFNRAERQGGALALLSAGGYYPPSFGAGTTFEANAADQRGGGLYAENAGFSTTGVSFVGNRAGTTSASGEGGAVFLAHPGPTVSSSLGYSSRIAQLTTTRFVQNMAGLRGGALAVADSSPLLTNCAFTQNQTDPLGGSGGAVAVFWETAQPSAPGTPAYVSAPRFVHATFATNRAALAANVHAATLTTPWIINSVLADGFLPPDSPSILGPRHLHGSQLAPPDALLSSAEAEAARRNIFEAPSLAYDWIHRATPARSPSDATATTGGVEPSSSVVFIRPTSDIDGETRPAAASGKFTLMRGCDEPRDTDADGLPDWFEGLAVQYSALDSITTISHTHPLTATAPTLPSANPTNNADADAYTLTQELLHGGRPDAPESEFHGRDTDGDGLSDLFERLTTSLDWTNPDLNGDGFSDGWAYRHFKSLTFDRLADDDQDGLTNEVEAAAGLDPRDADSDDDGVPDGWEQATNTDPLDADSDDDGTPDRWGPLPVDRTGTTPPGLHQPTAEEPWYIEHSWTYLQYDPGSYFYATEPSQRMWGIDTLNEEHDFVMDSDRAIPMDRPTRFTDWCTVISNIIGPRTQYKYASEFSLPLIDVTDLHRFKANPRFVPLTEPFEALPAELTSLLDQPRSPAWAAQWYAAVAASNSHSYLQHTIGRAHQNWCYHTRHHNIQHSIHRLVPSYRLRCTRPEGSPGNVSLTFIRVRGRAAAKYSLFNHLDSPHPTHSLDENAVTFEPVVLTLAAGQSLGKIVTLDPFQYSDLSTSHPLIPIGYPVTEYFDLFQFDALLPFDIIAHKRGTLNAPGERAPLGFGPYGQEVTLLENADYETTQRQNTPDYQQTGDLTDFRKANDDDLSKFTIRWPIGLNPNVFNVRLIAQGMHTSEETPDAAPIVEGSSRLRFYSDTGTQLFTSEVAMNGVSLVSGPPAEALKESGRFDFFCDGAQQFGSVDPILGDTVGEYSRRELNQALTASRQLGGAMIQMQVGTDLGLIEQNLLIYRGGFLCYTLPHVQPPISTTGVLGTLEFRDGKGRTSARTIDHGNVIATFSAKSGIRGGQSFRRVGGGGHIPPGWYITYRRTDFAETQNDVLVKASNPTIIRQGPYVRWLQDDAEDSAERYTDNYVYDSSNLKDRNIGLPDTLRFKWQLEPVPPNTGEGRTQLQIHPDGKKNGTMGCVGIQSYDDCLAVDDILSNYQQMELYVVIEE